MRRGPPRPGAGRNRHPFVALAHLPPPHPPFAYPLSVPPKIHHQKGTSGASSHPAASLSHALNSCHDTRTGCPPDEYSQHSIDCFTHIWTLDRTAYAAIYMWMNKYSATFYEAPALGDSKIFTVFVLTSFIYLLRMMNVPRSWFMTRPHAVTTSPPPHDL